MLLNGLKVVELATYIAAPGAGGILADWGAEVIKIESPEGDPIRLFFDTIGADTAGNPVFDLDNRGKKGVVLDIGKPEGRAVLLDMLRTADIFLTNLRPGPLKRAQLSWDEVRQVNPRLIMASVTGYGLEGPAADKPGFDLATFWAQAGVAALNTVKGAEPPMIRTGMGDHSCSVATVAAILAAVVERQTTGKGRLVETSLMRAGVYSVGSDMSIAMRFGRVASNRARPDSINPLNNFFKSADGRWICLLPRQGSGDWPKIARAARRPDLLDDERFTSTKGRKANGPALVAELDRGFAAMSFDEAAASLKAEDVVWAPVQSALDVIADPEAQAAGCFTEMDDGAGGVHTSPASPARFPGADIARKAAAPRKGQHTEEVLAQLGYDPERILKLKTDGILGKTA